VVDLQCACLPPYRVVVFGSWLRFLESYFGWLRGLKGFGDMDEPNPLPGYPRGSLGQQVDFLRFFYFFVCCAAVLFLEYQWIGPWLK
jgi:hypothetical protein